MPTSYYLGSSTADLSAGGAFNAWLHSDIFGANSRSTGAIAPGGGTVNAHSFTPTTYPGSLGGTGSQTYSVKVNVTAGGTTDVTLTVFLARINSAGTVQGSELQLGSGVAATTAIHTISGSLDLGTFAAGNRLRVRYQFVNDNMMTTYTLTLETNTANTEHITPWTMPNPAVAPTLLTPADLATHDGETFTWDFNTNNVGSPHTGIQAGFAFRRTEVLLPYQQAVSGTPTLGDTGEGVAFSPNGTWLAVGNAVSPRLTVITTSDWATVSGTPILTGVGASLAFSPDNTRLAIGQSASPYLRVLNTSGWSTISGTPTLAGYARQVAYSPDGSLLAIAHDTTPFLTVLNTSDWSTVSGTPTLAGDGNGVAFSPDNALLAIAHAITPFLRVLNTSDWSTVSGTPTVSGTGWSTAFSPNGSYLSVSHSFSPHVRVLNTSDWSERAGIPAPGFSFDTAFSPNNSFLAIPHFGSPHLTVAEEGLGSLWWNGSAWVTFEFFITSTAETITLPSGAWD